MAYDMAIENAEVGALDALALRPESRIARLEDLVGRERLEAFGSNFKTRIEPTDGVYGLKEVDKGNGLVERTTKIGDHRYLREYYQDGKLTMRRTTQGNKILSTTHYDSNGTAYLTETRRLPNEVIEHKLTPGAKVVKGNFTAEIDHLGRPVVNKMANVALRGSDVDRKRLAESLRNEAYKANDHRGHLIPDWFGGPASRENIVAQLDKVNQGKVSEIEKRVAEYVKEGHKVDYEMRANYVGSGERPSSFEPHITVDGKEVELPDDLKKIYNDASKSPVRHMLTTAGERLSGAHELGRQTGVIAAGLAFSASTVENVSAFVAGEISAEEMVTDIVGDTATAGAAGYGVAFVGERVSQAMASSASELISGVGRTCVPAAVVAFGVESFEDVAEFANGSIDAAELVYNLGDHAAGVAGGFAGGALAGAALGSVAGPVGTVAGSVIGGVVGCALSSEVYATAVEAGVQGAEIVGEQIEKFANSTVEAVGDAAPGQVADAVKAFNDFFSANDLPFSV